MNMRKIIAVLSAALMLCAAIPMGALSVAAAGDVIVDYNFDDGNAHFERGYVENGYMVFDATTADWQNCYLYANAMKANTTYVVTFKAMANKDAGLNVKINNNWAGDTAKETVSVSTEWQDFEVMINTGDLTGTALLMFTSDYTASSAPIYYIDDLKVVEYVEPVVAGTIVNGDFETGDETGWHLPQTGGVKAEAAHSGNYGMNVKGNGGWGGMLYQTFPVNAGNAYEISLWVKVIASGVNVQIKDGDTSGANLASEWLDMNKAGDWKQLTYIVTPTAENLTINLCGGGNGNAEDIYVDDVTVLEIKEPSFDGYITNGDFETGKADSWENVWGSCQTAIVDGRNGGYALSVTTPNAWNIVRQKVSVQPNTNYVVSLYAKNASGMTLLIKDGADTTNVKQTGIANGADWTKTSLEFNSGSYSEVYICMMGNNPGATLIADDFYMFEKVEPSNDGYIINGTFETGDIAPWNNLWGSCPKAEVVKGGMDSNWAIEIISGQWKHVRQTNIAVEANTNYKITAWAKNAAGMSLLVKDGGDSVDIVNQGIEAGEEWTEFVITFNTGDYTSIIFSLMGNNAEAAYGTFDNIVMEKVVAECEHNYEITNGDFATCETDGWTEYTCSLCGDSYTETITAYHNGGLEYTAAVEAIDCANPGNIEYYYCPGCYEYFADAEATEMINPWYITVTIDCVRPEGIADCATVDCEICGNEIYGYGEHDVLACQGGTCSKCGDEIEGYGCANYDTPACEDGVCYYCGGFVAGFGHENGAWAPCCDGECAYGCGLIYPAAEDHVDEDGNDYCDNCWSHLACADEDADGWCDVCWREMPAEPDVEIIYGDADSDGEITNLDIIALQQFIAGWEVTMDEVSADADGDGEITNLDIIALQQFIAGWDVVLGPQG